jgi:hypothetical protein
MKRPIGVSLIAFVFVIAGVANVLLGLQMTTAVTFGPLPQGTGTWVWGWLIVLTGIAYAGTGVGFWILHPLAWMAGQVLSIVGILEAVAALLGTGDLGYALATAAFPLIALWYLNRPSVKGAFEMDDF